jgi:hypothetical protein
MKFADDKQKVLLASTTGHFSLLKALHMADYITELNGKPHLLLGPLPDNASYTALGHLNHC